MEKIKEQMPSVVRIFYIISIQTTHVIFPFPEGKNEKNTHAHWQYMLIDFPETSINYDIEDTAIFRFESRNNDIDIMTYASNNLERSYPFFF